MTLAPTQLQSNNIFAVILISPNEEIRDRIASYRHYPISDTCYLVSSNEISEDIAIGIGLKGENRVSDALGIVFKLNGAYSGYSYKSVWEWIAQQEQVT